MRKLILFTVALLCAASLWADEMEGPWKYESMKSGTCGNNQNQSISYNQLDNSHSWGSIFFWNNDDGIGFKVEGTSADNSKNAVFSIYSMTRAIPSYAKCRFGWKFMIGSKNTRHYSRVALYANDNLEVLKALKVDFTIDSRADSGKIYRVWFMDNKHFYDNILYGPGSMDYHYFDFNNLGGHDTTDISTYLMLTHVVQTETGQKSLYELGALKHVELIETWSYSKHVSFHANGGSGMMDGLFFETSGNLPANTFVREGYTFAGWSTTPDGAVEYTDGAEITASENDKGRVNLYAVWTPDTYTIAYELNGGSAGNPTTYHFNEALALTAPTKADYSFLGWTGSNGNVPQTDVAIAKGSTGNKSFTAHWVGNAVAGTINLIAAIGTVEYTEACKEKIDAARSAYNALSTEDQALVSNYVTLIAAETAYEAARDAAGNTTINFQDKDDTPLAVQTIQLDYPEAPVIAGYTFQYWQVVEKNLSDGIIRLQAVYTSTPTDLDETIVNRQSSNRKFIKDGNLYILKDEFIYTINGQRVNKSSIKLNRK